MRSPARRRSLLSGAGLFAAGLAAGAALALRASTPEQAEVRAGATLAGYLPDAVLSLTYSTPEGTTTAQRSAPGAPFAILSTFADGRPAQRCGAPAEMGTHLARLTTLTARRSLAPARRASEFPVQLGVIDIRDAALGEPLGPILVFANRHGTALAAVLDGRAAEVTLPATELDWLKAPCPQPARLQPVP